MTEFGHSSLLLAWLLSLFAMLAGVFSAFNNSQKWYLSGLNATIAASVCAAFSFFSLGCAFLGDDFTNQYVWQYSNRSMDYLYKFTAIWGGMDGSLLVWAFFLTICGAIVALRSSHYPLRLMPWFLAVMNSSSLFFLSAVLFLANPFRYLLTDVAPPDGNGLNPLLQNPYMAIHPPMLYAGFTLFAVPFAFCLAALLSDSLDQDWTQITRRWALIAWIFLTAGIVLGAFWAYIELGWGGFWAWDPVENASLLPWLTGTAFIHAIAVQKQRRMFKTLNVWLLVITYGLTIFGTYITRSGIVQSVHAFGASDLGGALLTYLAAILTSALLLTLWRKKQLRAEEQMEQILSRESAVSVNSLLFLGICFATLCGIMLPVFSEQFTGAKRTVGPAFFNTFNLPLFLFMLFIMAGAPFISWKNMSASRLFGLLIAPAVLALIFFLALVLSGIIAPYPALSYAICLLVVLSIFREVLVQLITLTSRPERKTMGLGEALADLCKRQRVRWGAHLAHLGVAVAAIAITASMVHKTEEEFSLSVGQSKQIAGFDFALRDLAERREGNYRAVQANVSVRWAGSSKALGMLSPELRHFPTSDQNTSEIALRVGLAQDLYLVLAGFDDTGAKATFKLYVNPLQVWLWVGTVVMILGTLMVIVPRSEEDP